MNRGRLVIVGTGIRAGLETTIEARASIEGASKVLYLTSDHLSGSWIQKLNSTAESLSGFYLSGKSRRDIYEGIVEEILNWLRKTDYLCVVFYGHPGFFVYPGHEAVKRARMEGVEAKMLPGISSEDALFVDLGIDPGYSGYQGYEATSFLLYGFKVEPSASLILYQIGVIGEDLWKPSIAPRNLSVLVEYLQKYYPPDHKVVVYEACPYPIGRALIQRITLEKLPKARITALSTLYVPPRGLPAMDSDMIDRLEI